jgi:hypothetical protein
MAGNAHSEADSEARKWFTIAVIGTVLYVGTVFAFVITADVEHDGAQAPSKAQAEEQEHGQSK